MLLYLFTSCNEIDWVKYYIPYQHDSHDQPLYNVYRKDRNRSGGGVLVAIKSIYTSQSIQLETTCETVWARVSLKDQKTLLIGSFYRQPNCQVEQVEELNRVLESLANTRNSSCTTILGGDFNVKDINWGTHSVKSTSQQKAVSEKVLGTLAEHHLSQMQLTPTRENSVLDLFCINNPTLVKACNVIPGISDHEIILSDCTITPVYNKKKPRQVYMYSKADWVKIKEQAKEFQVKYLAEQTNKTVNENWSAIKSFITSTMNEHIPSKKSSSRVDPPWLTRELKRKCAKNKRMFKKSRRTGQQKHKQQYHEHKKATMRACRRAHWDYINSILNTSLEDNNTRPFWRYIKSRKQDNIGVAPLLDKGTMKYDAVDKCEVLSKQYQSVFTKEDGNAEVTLPGSDYPTINDIHIDTNGIEKLLRNLKVHKAAGPDGISCQILKELAEELAPVLGALFEQSLRDGVLPDDWLKANIAPIFKKGNQHHAENYRPVSLTCVTCKLLEHVICKHIHNHLDKHDILTEYQHGFRRSHSCETQLLTTIHDLSSYRDSNTQIDIGVLDFSKAFDTVPHKRLLSKLQYYGIRGPIQAWISQFLQSRNQSVVIDGASSKPVRVESGVPQGTVLGPLLFLLHINDLPTHVSSHVRLFADDCLIYRPIRNEQDQIALQNDLDALARWGDTWGMRFNVGKCNIMTICRTKSKHNRLYTIGGQVLHEVESAKYLGVTISNDLSWSPHITSVVKKANSTLGFLRRNLRSCPVKLKQTAYFSLVRSKLEYASPVWDPFLKCDIARLEQVQTRSVRFCKKNYNYKTRVTPMREELNWSLLEERRREARLTLFYKVVHGIVAVPVDNILIKSDSRTRSNHPYKFRQIQAKTEQFRNSFFPRTICDWNPLPADIVSPPPTDTPRSGAAFKERLRRVSHP